MTTNISPNITPNMITSSLSYDLDLFLLPFCASVVPLVGIVGWVNFTLTVDVFVLVLIVEVVTAFVLFFVSSVLFCPESFPFGVCELL